MNEEELVGKIVLLSSKISKVEDPKELSKLLRELADLYDVMSEGIIDE